MHTKRTYRTRSNRSRTAPIVILDPARCRNRRWAEVRTGVQLCASCGSWLPGDGALVMAGDRILCATCAEVAGARKLKSCHCQWCLRRYWPGAWDIVEGVFVCVFVDTQTETSGHTEYLVLIGPGPAGQARLEELASHNPHLGPLTPEVTGMWQTAHAQALEWFLAPLDNTHQEVAR